MTLQEMRDALLNTPINENITIVTDAFTNAAVSGRELVLSEINAYLDAGKEPSEKDMARLFGLVNSVSAQLLSGRYPSHEAVMAGDSYLKKVYESHYELVKNDIEAENTFTIIPELEDAVKAQADVEKALREKPVPNNTIEFQIPESAEFTKEKADVKLSQYADDLKAKAIADHPISYMLNETLGSMKSAVANYRQAYQKTSKAGEAQNRYAKAGDAAGAIMVSTYQKTAKLAQDTKNLVESLSRKMFVTLGCVSEFLSLGFSTIHKEEMLKANERYELRKSGADMDQIYTALEKDTYEHSPLLSRELGKNNAIYFGDHDILTHASHRISETVGHLACKLPWMKEDVYQEIRDKTTKMLGGETATRVMRDICRGYCEERNEAFDQFVTDAKSGAKNAMTKVSEAFSDFGKGIVNFAGSVKDRAAIAALTVAGKAYEVQLDILASRHKRLEEKSKQLDERNAELEEIKASLKVEIAEYDAEIDGLDEDLETYAEDAISLSHRFAEKQDEINKIHKAIGEISEISDPFTVRVLTRDAEKMERKLQKEIAEEESKITSKRENMVEMRDSTLDELHSTQQEILKVTKEIQNVADKMKAGTEKAETTISHLNEFKNKLVELAEKLDKRIGKDGKVD